MSPQSLKSSSLQMIDMVGNFQEAKTSGCWQGMSICSAWNSGRDSALQTQS